MGLFGELRWADVADVFNFDTNFSLGLLCGDVGCVVVFVGVCSVSFGSDASPMEVIGPPVPSLVS